MLRSYSALFLWIIILTMTVSGENFLFGKQFLGGLENQLLLKSSGHSHSVSAKLYNHCSERQLEISRKIDATGTIDSPYAALILKSVYINNHYGIQIFGIKSGRYLCFNKKKKLISRSRVRGHNKHCIFREIFSTDVRYLMLQSIASHLYVGFNRFGKPIPGNETKSYPARCYYFSKRENPYKNYVQEKQRHGPHIKHPNKLEKYLKHYKVNKTER